MIRQRIGRQRGRQKQNRMDTKEGKDDIAGNVMVKAVLLALADLWPGPLVARLAPSILTSLARGLPVAAFL